MEEEAAAVAGTVAQAAMGMEASTVVLVVMVAAAGSLVCQWDTLEANMAAVVRAAAVKERALSVVAATVEALMVVALTAEAATVAVATDEALKVAAATEEVAMVAVVTEEAEMAAATMVGAACSSLHTHTAPPHTSRRSSRTYQPPCASRCRTAKGSPIGWGLAETQS